jgi:NAD(P)-dependent dehydrogenase (short-subunit alcohol dehydrogenase family)
LKNKVVIITGGGSGLGRESSVLFSKEGASVVVADISVDRANATAKLVEDQGGRAVAVRADVRDEADVMAAVDVAVDQFGQLDVMFANAGVVGDGGMTTPIDRLTLEQWNDVFAVNAVGVFMSVKHAVRAFKLAKRHGTILVTSSAASLAGYPELPAYTATKGAVNALVRALAYDLGRFGIRINALCPTHGMSPNFVLPIDAAVVGASYEESQGEWDPKVSPIPLKLDRPPGLHDNANAALFLASDESAYMSGVCLPTCDGGTLSKVAMVFEEGWQEDVVAKL